MDGEKYGLAFRDDYALISTTQQLADKYAAEQGSLADNAELAGVVRGGKDLTGGAELPGSPLAALPATTFGLFVDLDKVEKLYLANLQGEEKANAQVLRAVGFGGTQTDTKVSFSLRVLFN